MIKTKCCHYSKVLNLKLGEEICIVNKGVSLIKLITKKGKALLTPNSEILSSRKGFIFYRFLLKINNL